MTDSENTEEIIEEEDDKCVRMDSSPITEISDKSPSQLDIIGTFLSLINMDAKELEEATGGYPNIDGTTGEEGKAWLTAFQSGVEHINKGSALSGAANRKEAKWKQKLEVAGEQLGAGRPRYGSSASGVISGEKALMKASAALGLGSHIQIPLWHTGIWVKIKAPTEASLLELERRIASEKIDLGRHTSGMIFSNTTVYVVSHVINFILNHVYEASIKNVSQDALKNIIKATDIPTLVWGMVSTIYPAGYKYARPCTANPAECQHIVSGKINLAKLFYVDNDALSARQGKMMVGRDDKFTTEQLAEYEKEHIHGGDYTAKITDELSIKLAVPTIAAYERSGFAWVDGIVKLMEGSLSTSLNSGERDEYISEQGKLTALRQFTHWVKEINIGDDTMVDVDTIEQFSNMLSSKDEIYEKFLNEIGKYIDNATIALIAIPKWECPKCSAIEDVDGLHNNRYPHLLPLDVLRVFFTLLGQQLTKALTTRTL